MQGRPAASVVGEQKAAPDALVKPDNSRNLTGLSISNKILSPQSVAWDNRVGANRLREAALPFSAAANAAITHTALHKRFGNTTTGCHQPPPRLKVMAGLNAKSNRILFLLILGFYLSGNMFIRS